MTEWTPCSVQKIQVDADSFFQICRIYEACTRSTPTNTTDYYWCPSKLQADADKAFNGTTHGLCNDYAQPPDNRGAISFTEIRKDL